MYTKFYLYFLSVIVMKTSKKIYYVIEFLQTISMSMLHMVSELGLNSGSVKISTESLVLYV